MLELLLMMMVACRTDSRTNNWTERVVWPLHLCDLVGAIFSRLVKVKTVFIRETVNYKNHLTPD